MLEDIFDQSVIAIDETKLKLVLKVIEDNEELYNQYKFADLYKILSIEETHTNKILTPILTYALELSTGLDCNKLLRYVGDTVPKYFCCFRKNIKEIIIPSNIKFIENYAFATEYTENQKLYLDKSVRRADSDITNHNNTFEIYYNGTAEEFNKIENVNAWINGFFSVVVDCSDTSIVCHNDR